MTYVKVILLYMAFYTLHELAHILSCYIFGYTIESIKFKWIGININFKEEIINPIYDVAISLSGPISNLICCLFFIMLYRMKFYLE